MKTTPPLLAVLIDADNTSAKWAQPIFEEIATLGEASVRRVYGDFSGTRLKGWSEIHAEFGLVPQQQHANTVGKNASDIALVIDAMDLMHTGRFDGFVLVSSDSDFTRLASRLREQGLDVYGIGRNNTPEAFRKACKRFLIIENLLAEDDGEKSAGRTGPDSQPEKEPPSKVNPLVRAAMNRISQEGEWYNLSQIGQFISNDKPDFDPRTYGSKKLSDVLRASGAFDIKKEEGAFFVRKKTAAN